MSRIHQLCERLTVPSRQTLRQTARHLVATAARAIVSSIARRAARRAHRELAALDDRLLADVGLVRTELILVLDALAETRAATVLAQFPWNRRRMSA